MTGIRALIILAFVSVGVAQAQSGLAFLRIGVNAESLAMGDAGVASVTGPYATYWNPAGMASGSNGLSLSHHSWLGDIRTYAAAGRFGLGSKSGVGFFVTATGSGDLEARESPGPPSGTFDAQFLATGMSIGRSFGSVSAGVSVKYLTERIFGFSAEGYAFDFGLRTSVMDGSVRLGAALQNVGSMEELDARATPLPRTLRAGVAVNPLRVLTESDDAVVVEAEFLLEYSRDLAADVDQIHIGAGARVMDILWLRVGYLTNDALRDLSAGIGLQVSTFQVDYAVLPFESGFDGTGHIITLNYTFDR